MLTVSYTNINDSKLPVSTHPHHWILLLFSFLLTGNPPPHCPFNLYFLDNYWNQINIYVHGHLFIFIDHHLELTPPTLCWLPCTHTPTPHQLGQLGCFETWLVKALNSYIIYTYFNFFFYYLWYLSSWKTFHFYVTKTQSNFLHSSTYCLKRLSWH